MVHLQGRTKLSWFSQEKHFRYNYEIILATKVILNVGFLLSSFFNFFVTFDGLKFEGSPNRTY